MTIKEDALFGDTTYHVKTGAPVFATSFDWETDDPVLHSVWITERVEDLDGNYLGRTYVALYPPRDDPDEEGWLALEYGGRYYVEGMGYTDVADHEARVDCFRAAEMLYLHAARKGNPYAWQNLGYIYSYDRCEGSCSEAGTAVLTASTREERAFECYKHAADAKLPEATYKLGDLYKRGMGCEPDAAETFRCYERAFELGKNEHPVIWGSIALRLADCYENAFGCEQSFSKALKWYEQAVTGLDIAVREGEWFYEKALTNARNGVRRCKQELSA